MNKSTKYLVVTLTAADELTLRRLAAFMHMRSMRGSFARRILSDAFSRYIMRLIAKIQATGKVTNLD